MARTEARIFASIWKDQAFRALDPSSQRMYLFLLSQADLSYCGVISLRPTRWARSAAGLTPDAVMGTLKALAEPFPEPFAEPFPEGFQGPSQGPFLVVDEDTEEVLIRSFIRHDGLWKQPNLIKAAREAATLIESPRILTALAADLRRIPVEESSSDLVRTLMAEFIEGLEKACPKGSPDPSPNPSRNPSPNPSQEKGEGNGSREEVLLSPSSSLPSPREDRKPAAPERLDVERLCRHLADRIEGNGSKRPTVTQGWRDAARLMLDKDGRTEEQIHRAIDWCQDSEFWRSNVLSMPKLREKYDQLRLKAIEQGPRRPTAAPQSTADQRFAAAQALKAAFDADEEPRPAIQGEIYR